MIPNSVSPSFQPRGCVRPVLKVKGDWERVPEPASNGLCPLLSSRRDGSSMDQPMWGMLMLAISCVPFLGSGQTLLEPTSSAGVGHVLGPKPHLSVLFSVRLLLTVGMDTWHHECMPFWPNFAAFAILG